MKYFVVGCGISGATVARRLADCGKSVCIVERRNHIGGNMYDYFDDFGILVHKYGPHTFHTNNIELYNFIAKFSEWSEYKLVCGAEWNGVCTPTPFNFKTIDQFYSDEDATALKNHIRDRYGDREYVSVLEALESPDSLIKSYAEFLFDNDYSLYTAKQWGIDPKEVDPSVLKRVPLCFSYKEGYFEDRIQVMPKISYTDFFKKLLNHSLIDIKLGVNFKDIFHIVGSKIKLIDSEEDIFIYYTGALDELFSYCYGRLPYRSLEFIWHHNDVGSVQNYPVVAYPKEDYTRITDYSLMQLRECSGSTFAIEYSIAHDGSNEPYYPVLTKDSLELYDRYLTLSKSISNLKICGRLADFKYYNMDQALERSLSIELV